MKMKQEHYNALKGLIEGLGIESIKNHMQDLPFRINFPVVRDLKERVRWDCLHATNHTLPLYDYLNDDHIDTALRNIMVEIGVYK